MGYGRSSGRRLRGTSWARSRPFRRRAGARPGGRGWAWCGAVAGPATVGACSGRYDEHYVGGWRRAVGLAPAGVGVVRRPGRARPRRTFGRGVLLGLGGGVVRRGGVVLPERCRRARRVHRGRRLRSRWARRRIVGVGLAAARAGWAGERGGGEQTSAAHARHMAITNPACSDSDGFAQQKNPRALVVVRPAASACRRRQIMPLSTLNGDRSRRAPFAVVLNTAIAVLRAATPPRPTRRSHPLRVQHEIPVVAITGGSRCSASWRITRRPPPIEGGKACSGADSCRATAMASRRTSSWSSSSAQRGAARCH
jgi:hypothetical protein